jgi:hypothetical protein
MLVHILTLDYRNKLNTDTSLQTSLMLCKYMWHILPDWRLPKQAINKNECELFLK